jgi:Mannosyltransferase (PIG-V)
MTSVVDPEASAVSLRSNATSARVGRLWADSGRPWTEALKFDVLIHAIAFPLAYVGNLLIAQIQGRTSPGWWHIWSQWDVPLYVGIARHGYTGPEALPHSVAFFPFLPLALRGLIRIGMPGVGAGLLISGIALLIALAYLYRLANEFHPGSGQRALLYLCIFPMAVFLVAGYSEPLFLAGVIPAFYYARRERWLLVAPFAALAVGTRFAGIFLLFGLGVSFLQQRSFTARRIAEAIVALGAGLAPLIGYGIFLWRKKGTPLAYFHAERAGWGRHFSWPLTSFIHTLEHHAEPGHGSHIWDAAWRVEILAAFIGVGFTVWAIRRWELGWAAYMAGTLATLMLSSLYFSVPRMLLSLFPIPLLLAEYTATRPRLRSYLLGGMGTIAAIGIVVFTHGIWFF